MASMFGHKWTSSYGDSDDGAWLKGLQGLSLEEIAHGITQCLNQGGEWPPTLPQFKGMCLKSKKGLTHNSAAYQYFDKSRAIERKPDRDKAKSAIDQIKDNLKG